MPLETNILMPVERVSDLPATAAPGDVCFVKEDCNLYVCADPGPEWFQVSASGHSETLCTMVEETLKSTERRRAKISRIALLFSEESS